MILCIGEILADMIGNMEGEVCSYSRYVGGAPLNVACAIKNFGKEVGFYGRVGNDSIGKFLIDYVNKKNFDFSLIEIDEQRNTTLAFVDLDSNGEREFTFYRKNTADYALDINAIDSQLNKAEIIHIGSLMMSEGVGRAFADEIVKRAKQLGKKISFDVNFRSDIFKDKKEAVEIYSRYVKCSDILKLSEEEAELFSDKCGLQEKLAEIGADGKLIVVTLGKNGSAYYYRGIFKTVPSISVKPVDTTGAGDGFFGAFLSQVDLASYSNIEYALKFANIVGALTTTKKGALNDDLNVKIIKELMEK